ncbi:MAG: type II secretion system protein [Rhodocyclales bacterium]|nr:type II secretion system protein [Rhodocyclales bacterium]
MRQPFSKPCRQSGVTYVGVLVLVALMGITAAVAADVWHTSRKRDSERELLFIGNQFRQAIGHYYEQSPGPAKTFPRQLADLLRDPRTPGMKRHLRRIYPDPITGSDEWGLVKGPSGEILGVFSRSEAVPLKQANFRKADASFENKQRYSEWTFVYTARRSPTANSGQRTGRAVPPAAGWGSTQKTGTWERTW